MLDLLWIPFLACLVLTAIHVYLGLHVLARGVIFVDLALAQVAALGITVALSRGPSHPERRRVLVRAGLRGGRRRALLAHPRPARAIPRKPSSASSTWSSAALTVLVVDRAPQGAEHIKQLLVGSLLTVTPGELARIAVLYAVIGVGHALVRRPLVEISFDPEMRRGAGRAIRWWDFAFYVTFGVVVTSSVRIAGVLLVFSYLIVPAAVGALLTSSVRGRLAMGWVLGAAVSAVGLWASFAWDLPTGAAIVASFGVLMAVVAAGLGARALLRGGRDALFGVGIAAGAVGRGGRTPPHCLPAHGSSLAQLARGRRPRHRSSSSSHRPSARPGGTVARRSRAGWRRCAGSPRSGRRAVGARDARRDQKERLRQFLAARGEITAGDRFVLRTLRDRARERQRYWLGVPMLLGGAAAALALRACRGGVGVSPATRPGRAARPAEPPEAR